MLNPVINRVVFDLHCQNEATATQLGKDIPNHTWIKINAILSRVLDKYANSPVYYRFDKIEIDLGNLVLADFDSEDITRRFEFMLEEQINSHKKEILAADQVEWEMIKSWLLLGDLPWWVDKKNDASIERLTKQLIQRDPQRINRFVQEHADKPYVMQRLHSIHEYLNIQPPTAVTRTPVILPDSYITSFEQVIEKERTTTREVRQFLNELRTIAGRIKPDTLNAAQRRFLRLLENDDSKTPEELVELLKTLPIMQLRKLLFGRQNKTKDESTRRYYTLEKNQLTTLFRSVRLEKKRRKQLIREISLHPYLFKYQLLQLVIERGIALSTTIHSTHPLEKAWKKAGRVLKRQLKNLSTADKIVYTRLASYGYSGKKTEHTLVEKILAALDDKPLQVLELLTRLPENEVSQLMPPREADIDATEHLLIENGGLCLLANYLPAFFNNIGYLEKNKFKSDAYAMKAVHLLAYITSGKKLNPEYQLSFNKLLCGLPVTQPMVFYSLAKHEYAEADELVQAVIGNWPALKNTSNDGFRTSFLLRSATLTEESLLWKLRVEKTGVDVLLGTLPWSYNLIKLPWMNKSVEVEW